NVGRDVIIAGAGNDMADGDQQDDMIFGDQAFLSRRLLGTDVGTDITAIQNITSPRFQALCGAALYSRSDLPAESCGGTITDSGQLLVDGVARNYRDPDSPGIDTAPWWAEYAVNFSDGDTTHHFHDLTADLGYA